MSRILVTLVLCLAASGCMKKQSWAERFANNSNPLTALHADAVSTRYTKEFWLAHKKKNTYYWQHASVFCNTHDEYTNCYPVNDVFGPRKVAVKTTTRRRKKRRSKTSVTSKQPLTWSAVQKKKIKQAKKLKTEKADEKKIPAPTKDANKKDSVKNKKGVTAPRISTGEGVTKEKSTPVTASNK